MAAVSSHYTVEPPQCNDSVADSGDMRGMQSHTLLTGLDAHTVCNASLYPNLSILLQILATIPVTTAMLEHSFSTLKRLDILSIVSGTGR